MASCNGTVTKAGTNIKFRYEEDQANNNRFIYIICNPQRTECLYCHAAGSGPIEICEKDYHRNPPAFYEGLAQLIANNYNDTKNTWPNNVVYKGITYSVDIGYPRPYRP